jgi:hypothetical protein
VQIIQQLSAITNVIDVKKLSVYNVIMYVDQATDFVHNAMQPNNQGVV